MNNGNSNPADREALTRRDSRNRALWSWGGYLLTLVAWAGAVIALAFLGLLVCSSINWFAGSLLYRLLTWVRDIVVLVGGLAVLAGWVAISYFFIARPERRVDALTAAAAKLARPDDTPITLPRGLEEAEVQLNLAREQALRDAQAAREAEQRKNDLVVYLAHDLKTPLTSVIGYLTLLRDEPDLSPEARARYTGVALDKAERLEDLINECFDITRFNLSHLELELQRVDLTRMLQQLVSEFAPMLREKGLSCRLALPEKLDYRCDPDKMARVFDNLLRNACHYSYPDSAVDIAVREEPGWLVLTFENAGRTIPPEKLERIFQQFFRLDESRASRTGGAGLGLAIARQIVEAHGGAIRAESQNDRIRFTIFLPQAEDAAS